MPAHGRGRHRRWLRRPAGAWIELRRSLLRAIWAVRRLNAAFPAWIVGTTAGTLAVMLAILLFFIRDPDGAAKASSAEVGRTTGSVAQASASNPQSILSEPRPTPAEFPLMNQEFSAQGEQQWQTILHQSQTLDLQPSTSAPRPSPESPKPAAKLELELVRTRLPSAWNQSQLTTITSQSKPLPAGWMAMAHSRSDGWNTAVPRQDRAEELNPYLLLGTSVPVELPTVVASNRPEEVIAAAAVPVPGLEVEKSVPGPANAGNAFSYDIYVRNPTSSTVDHVVVREKLSDIHRVTAVAPVAAVEGDELLWSLGAMPPQDERKLTVTLVAGSEAPIDTVAILTATTRIAGGITQVHPPKAARPSVFEFEGSPHPISQSPVADTASQPPAHATEHPTAEVIPPRPVLKLTSTPPTSVQVGETFAVLFTVTNTGTAVAEDLILYAKLSERLQHRYGHLVEHEILRLEPGESHRAVLRATADEPGDASIEASLTMEGTDQLQQLQLVNVLAGIPARQ